MKENEDSKVDVLASEYLFREPWLTVRKDKIRLPNGVIIPDYYILEYCDWVNILAITKERKFLMIRQYRHGSGTTNYEFCGGCVDAKDASPLAAAQRELLEETGYGNGRWRMNMRMSANPSTSNNWTYNFIAEDVELLGEQNLDGGECISVHLFSLDEIKQLLENNEIIQSVHVASLWKYLAENKLL